VSCVVVCGAVVTYDLHLSSLSTYVVDAAMRIGLSKCKKTYIVFTCYQTSARLFHSG